MINELVKNRILTLKIATATIPLLGTLFLGFSIWLFTLLGSPHANPDSKMLIIITAVVLILLALMFFLFWIIVIPRLIKNAEKSLIEYEKMKNVYEKHKDNN